MDSNIVHEFGFDKYNITTADGASWRTRFCYEHSIDAVLAVQDWDGQGDPPGPWLKQKPEDRLGPGMVHGGPPATGKRARSAAATF